MVLNFNAISNNSPHKPYPLLIQEQASAGQGKNKNFNYYLAGLIEGDGTIIVPNLERDKKGRLTYSNCIWLNGFTFSSNDSKGVRIWFHF
jgi:hypothetical protein